MKRLIIFFLLFPICVYPQTYGKISYKLTTGDDKIFLKSTINSILYFNDKASIELRLKKNDNIDRQVDENSEIKIINMDRKYFILKKFASKNIIHSDNIFLKNFLITDTLKDFNWKITKEKKTILNYLCTKAITQFRGRNYEAWYTESIPIQNGPWKFYGLPGLIIKVADVENKFVYELTGIELKVKFDRKIIEVPKEYAKDKPINHKQFIILFNKKLEDYAKLSKVIRTEKNGSQSSVTIILPQKMEKF